jgi:hypothetical protein
LLEVSETVSVSDRCPEVPGAKRRPMRHREPGGRPAPLVQVVVPESITKLLPARPRLPITSDALLRNGFAMMTILSALAVPTLWRPKRINFGVNAAGPAVGVGVGDGVGVGIGVGVGAGVGVGVGVAVGVGVGVGLGVGVGVGVGVAVGAG